MFILLQTGLIIHPVSLISCHFMSKGSCVHGGHLSLGIYLVDWVYAHTKKKMCHAFKIRLLDLMMFWCGIVKLTNNELMPALSGDWFGCHTNCGISSHKAALTIWKNYCGVLCCRKCLQYIKFNYCLLLSLQHIHGCIYAHNAYSFDRTLACSPRLYLEKVLQSDFWINDK